MPQALGFLLFAGPLGSVFSFGTLVAASQVAIGLGLSLAANLLFRPKAPDMPKPEDGKYNLRQNVPSLVVALGKVKKSSDYILLEEKGGVAYHAMVPAGHRINGFVSHYLHDELVTLDVNGKITAPAHFLDGGVGQVTILTRVGLDAETAYANLVSALPTIWTDDHRGDGLASVMMAVQSVDQHEHQSTYPQQMPAHSAVIEGALLYDPRDESTAYSTNLALMRLFHLTHPSGGKMTLDDMHLPDWINAANVCDEQVTNMDGATENRYHGGLWYRYENNPVEVGRVMDQAAELVLYETAEGKVGVHAGEYVAPDVRLTEDDILAVSFDANRRKNSNVLAVRGRFTDPGKVFNTVDAAIYGDPYTGDATERTKTVDNVAVQSHNHIQRLQKIAFIRANAPRVRVLCDYEPAKLVPYRRFIKVHYPPKLDEAIIEITGRPKLSLRNLTYEFEGIVVPSTLYDFDAATEEGEPPAEIVALVREDVPAPANLQIAIDQEIVAAGQTAAFATATWDAQSALLTVELEWQPSAGGTMQSVQTQSGETELRTGYLADGTEYRFRARNWSAGVPSAWTDYVLATAVADPAAPGALTGVSVTGGQLGHADLAFTTPASANIARVAVYRAPAGVALDRNAHLVTKYPVLMSTAYAKVDGDDTRTNLVAGGDFAATGSWNPQAGWSIGSGVASKTAGLASYVYQFVSVTSGATYRYAFTVASISAGSFAASIFGGSEALGALQTTTGQKLGSIVNGASNTAIGIRANDTAAGSVDDFSMYLTSGAEAPQGVWDYYIEAENASGVRGPTSTVTNVTII